MKTSDVLAKLDIMIPNPRCELNYSKDYELLIATMLSAQCTDKRVNEVTKVLFQKYTLEGLKDADVKSLEKEIYTLGSYSKKAKYIKSIAKHLLDDCGGKVPNDRTYLETLPGVGRKTASVVLSELFDVPTIAVDTHVERVSKRLGFAKEGDNLLEIEEKLKKELKEYEYNKVNHQLVLFGRYICKAVSPDCANCLIKCQNKKTS